MGQGRLEDFQQELLVILVVACELFHLRTFPRRPKGALDRFFFAAATFPNTVCLDVLKFFWCQEFMMRDLVFGLELVQCEVEMAKHFYRFSLRSSPYVSANGR